MFDERILNITGWFSENECRRLYDIALNIEFPRILEIGAFCGKSTACLASAMKERDGVVISCDIFPKNVKYWGKNEDIVIPNSQKVFTTNMKRLNLEKYIVSIKRESSTLLNEMAGKFGLMFIDGGHRVDKLMIDGLYAFNNVVKGGMIIFHDYGNDEFPDVKDCVDFLAERYNVYMEVHDLLAILRR